MADISLLTAGTFATYWRVGVPEKTVLVNDVIEGGAAVPRRYQVMDWDTGATFQTPGCWLRPLQVDQINEIMPMEEDLVFEDASLVIEEPAEPAHPATVSTPKAQNIENRRFHNMTEEELDQLADSRTSKHTKIQTKWGIQIFAGEFFSAASTPCLT